MKKIILILIFLFLYSCSGNNNKDFIEDIKIPNDFQIQDKKVILALGDSLTAGYGVEESENYPSKLQKLLDENNYNYEIINAGVSGDTSLNLKDRAEAYLDKDPNIVILVIGGNDGLRGLSVTDLKNNIIDIINIYKKTNAKIVLSGMDIPINLGLQYRNDFKKLYKDIADTDKDIYFQDFFLEGVAGDSTLNIEDRVHPNAKGYDIVSKNMYDFLKDNKIIEK